MKLNQLPILVGMDYACNFFRMLWAFVLSIFNLTKYQIAEIDIAEITPEFRDKLKRFEASFTYPFSNEERFRIEHGEGGDYFAFFNRLGKVYCYAATYKGEIAALVCGVLRSVSTKSGQLKKAWYICDMKVGKKYQGEHLPLMLFQKGGWRYFQAPRGYGICMNPSGRHRKASKLWSSHSPISGLNSQTLNLYTLSAEQAEKNWLEIEKCLGKPLSLISTKGVKDYQIFSSNGERPWPLLHFQSAVNGMGPQPDHTHMMSAVSGSPSDANLKELLGPPTSTAEIVSFGMDQIDFNFITSDQI